MWKQWIIERIVFYFADEAMPERVKKQSCFMFRSMSDGEILQLKQSKESGIEIYKRKKQDMEGLWLLWILDLFAYNRMVLLICSILWLALFSCHVTLFNIHILHFFGSKMIYPNFISEDLYKSKQYLGVDNVRNIEYI